MEKHRKAIRIAYWCFLIAGSLVVGMVIAALELSGSAKKLVAAGWIVTAVGLMVLIDLLWGRELKKQINTLNKILMEERDPDRYITQLNALLEGKRSLQLRQLRLINLGAAYCEKKEYETAKQYFLQIRPAKLHGINRWIYWADLALAQFYLGEDAEACAIMMEQKTYFERLKDSQELGGALAILTIFRLLAEGDTAAAKEYLEEQQPKWEDARSADDFAFLRARLDAEKK